MCIGLLMNMPQTAFPRNVSDPCSGEINSAVHINPIGLAEQADSDKPQNRRKAVQENNQCL